MRPNAYKLALGGGVVVSSHLFMVLGARAGLPIGAAVGAYVLVLLGALVGARLLHVLEHRARFRAQHRRAWSPGDPGAASFGGILGALATAVPLSLELPLPLGRVLDLVMIAGLPGLAVGRVGCLLHGCCPGRTRVPLQLLQIAGALSAWGFALVCAAVHDVPGTAFCVAAIVYSLLRLSTDFLRDLPRGPHGLAASQVVASALALVGALGLFLSPLAGAS